MFSKSILCLKNVYTHGLAFEKQNTNDISSFTPRTMERALRKNIMYHSQYNPKLDSITNRLVCKYVHKCGEEPLQLSKKKALFDRRYF